MNESLKRLYQDVIMAHQRHPVRYEKRELADRTLEAYNPLCGDKYQLFLELDGPQLTDAAFYGHGCAISKASTSVLIQSLPGKQVESIQAQVQTFQKLLQAEEIPADVPEEWKAFTAVRDFPGRMTCVTLSWEALADFLRDYKY